MLRKLLIRFQSLLWKASWRVAERRNICGFDVGISAASNAEEEQRAFQKIEAALKLIQVHDARRFRRLRTDVRRLQVFGRQAQYLGRWVDSLKTCQLATDWVLRADTRSA